ncbi:hypothetical protein [Gluconacetobacter asukensis]|uniref:Uncharacterized protein n=1 Tax=Gluconacetobacter asukensis TaxID=1017181 RepID=A0A7W4J1A8_9PROT|nr:hypothetical protein [Gluconacetobacter asukensis]MBB2172861.1 hypothetical protein [Gluconacetobacter asukensis]
MARIRTIHPGLYTDEAFATLSMAARVLIIGIWSHADDGGGFEWKPLTLKMRVFPADMLDVTPLLEELVQNDIVMKYDVDGKTYGAVRNFGKWQRPKKPSRFVPMPEHVRNYARTNEDEKGDGSEPEDKSGPVNDPKSETSSEPVPNQSGISQTEGRKVGRKEGNNSLPSVESSRMPVTETPGPARDFEEFWAAYPRKVGKDGARKAFDKARKRAGQAEIMVGLSRHIAVWPGANDERAQFIPHPATWLNRGDWQGDAASSAAAGRPSSGSPQSDRLAIWDRVPDHPGV